MLFKGTWFLVDWFHHVLNNRLVQCLDKEGVLHEGQAGFRVGRSCMDNVYSLNEIVQGRLREGQQTYAFFLDVRKAYGIQYGVMVCGLNYGKCG